MFLQSDCTSYIPTSNAWEFQFLRILTDSWHCQSFLYCSLYLVCKGISLGLFSGLLMLSAIFSWKYFPFTYLLWWSISQIFCPPLKLGYFLLLRCKNFLCSWYMFFLLNIHVLWIFFSKPTAFYFLIDVLQRAKGFNFDEVQNIIFFYGLCFCLTWEILAYHEIWFTSK